jgi:hypothetical protein
LTVSARDLQAVAPLALRQRRSQFMTNYFAQQSVEDRQINALLDAKVRRSR